MVKNEDDKDIEKSLIDLQEQLEQTKSDLD